MIVKNEEENLPRCLKSLDGVCDEIVVVDTGSTDNSVDIAREAGARVEFFKWNGNEADARNYSVSKAKGDWLLMVDADEELSRPLHDEIIEIIPQLAAKKRYRSCSLLWENHYLGGETSCTRILRLNCREGFAFAGGIHPTATYQPETYALRGALRHYGYQWTEEKRQRKAQHILEHLRPYLSDPHPTFDRWCQYLTALTLIGEEGLFVQAWDRLHYYTLEERIASASTPAWLENSANFFRYFSCRDDFENAACYADEIIRAYPRHATSRFYRLQRRIKMRAWAEAAEDASHLLENITHDPGPANPAWPALQGPTARAWHWLAQSRLKQETTEEPPAWLIAPLTLPVFLFENRAPSVSAENDSDGAALLRELIEIETIGRCYDATAALKRLSSCLRSWSQLNWLRIGLGRLESGEQFNLETLANRAAHLT